MPYISHLQLNDFYKNGMIKDSQFLFDTEYKLLQLFIDNGIRISKNETYNLYEVKRPYCFNFLMFTFILDKDDDIEISAIKQLYCIIAYIKDYNWELYIRRRDYRFFVLPTNPILTVKNKKYALMDYINEVGNRIFIAMYGEKQYFCKIVNKKINLEFVITEQI